MSKKSEKRLQGRFSYRFLIELALRKSHLFCFVVAKGSQFLDKNEKKFIIYTFIDKSLRQTALIGENCQFYNHI